MMWRFSSKWRRRFAGLFLFLLWSEAEARAVETRHDASPISVWEVGRNQGQGNVVGMQPYMLTTDYRSEQTFAARLDTYLAIAHQKGWLHGNTVVVFPEMIGFYLLDVQEQDTVYTASSQREAAARMIAAHGIMPPSDAANRSPQEVERLLHRRLQEKKANRMAAIYQNVFGTLAHRYRVTIVAGSILLPSPTVAEGKLCCDISGPITNVSAVFRPDGSLTSVLVRKVYPTHPESEELGVVGGKIEALPVFSTPAGSLGIAICADSWYPRTYQILCQKGARLVVVPAYFGDSASFGARWKGYSLGTGVQPPADVIPNDIGTLTEGAAWRKYAMPGRLGASSLRAASIPCGITVFLRGRLWENVAEDAVPFVMDRGELRTPPPTASNPGILCFWLPAGIPLHRGK